jgi:small subunit ribosomal protein S6
MRNYEVAFIAHPELDEAAFAALVEKAQSWVTAAGGQLVKTDIWGRRHLAYPIRKQKEGQYVLMEAQLESQATREIERNLRLTEQVLRFQIVRTDA